MGEDNVPRNSVDLHEYAEVLHVTAVFIFVIRRIDVLYSCRLITQNQEHVHKRHHPCPIQRCIEHMMLPDPQHVPASPFLKNHVHHLSTLRCPFPHPSHLNNICPRVHR